MREAFPGAFNGVNLMASGPRLSACKWALRVTERLCCAGSAKSSSCSPVNPADGGQRGQGRYHPVRLQPWRAAPLKDRSPPQPESVSRFWVRRERSFCPMQ